MKTFAALEKTLGDVCVDMNLVSGARRLPGIDQMLTNALGITLARRWVALAPAGNLHFYFPEHRNGRTSHFEAVPAKDKKAIKEAGKWHKYSFLVDLFVESWTGGAKTVRRETPVLAAEVEAYPKHGVADDVDKNNYQWDFYKLLHVRAPRRLFVACSSQVTAVEESLCAAHERAAEAVFAAEDTLAVVLLPADETAWTQVRLGLAFGHDGLEFKGVKK